VAKTGPQMWVNAGPVRGPQGVPGLSGYTVVKGEAVVLAPKATKTITLDCPAGKVALGGGVSGASMILESYPLLTGAGWKVTVHNPHGTAVTVTPYLTAAVVAPAA
jgi:hypothetical protein